MRTRVDVEILQPGEHDQRSLEFGGSSETPVSTDPMSSVERAFREPVKR